MKRTLVVSGLVLGMCAAVLPAQAAVQLASYNSAGLNFIWVEGAHTQGSLTGKNDVSLTFDAGDLDGATLLAQMVLTATTNEKAVTLSGTVTEQEVLTGSFEYIYEGPTETLDGVNLVKGSTDLLSGSFSDAEIIGLVGSNQGSFSDSSTTGTVDIATAAGANLSGNTYSAFDFTLGNTTKAFPNLPSTYNKSLGNFDADTTASFFVNSVPEPTAWIMMLLGMFSLGAMLRVARRRDGAWIGAAA